MSAFAADLYLAAVIAADRILAAGELELDEALALMATLEEIREALVDARA